MKAAILCLLFAGCIVSRATAQVRPKEPDAKTLASATSQIKAWYLYAVYIEEQLAAAKKDVEILRAVNETLAKIEQMKAQLATVVPMADFNAAERAKALSEMERMQLAGKVLKYETLLKAANIKFE